MNQFSSILRTKIIPPPRNARTMSRPRVSEQLRGAFDYRLTILLAGAGYGKSTALAEFAAETQPLVWYQVSEEDGDPLVFLLHLFHATREALPEITDLPRGMERRASCRGRGFLTSSSTF